MTKLTFVIEGEHQHIELVRHQIDGVIDEVIDDAVEAGRLRDGDLHVDWTWDD